MSPPVLYHLVNCKLILDTIKIKLQNNKNVVKISVALTSDTTEINSLKIVLSPMGQNNTENGVYNSRL
jgi:hypothetical protein